MGRFKYIPLFWTSLGVFLFTFKFYFITSYIGSLLVKLFFYIWYFIFYFFFLCKGKSGCSPFCRCFKIYICFLFVMVCFSHCTCFC